MRSLVFDELATLKSFKAQSPTAGIQSSLPRVHRTGSYDRVEIMAVRFSERVDWYDHRVEVEPFDLSVHQSVLSDFKGLTAKSDLIGLCNNLGCGAFHVFAKNIGLESAGIEKCFHRLAFNFNCLNHAAH